MNLSDFLFFCSFARRTLLLQDLILLLVFVVRLSLRGVSSVGSCFTFTTLQQIWLELITQNANVMLVHFELKSSLLEIVIKKKQNHKTKPLGH